MRIESVPWLHPWGIIFQISVYFHLRLSKYYGKFSIGWVKIQENITEFISSLWFSSKEVCTYPLPKKVTSIRNPGCCWVIFLIMSSLTDVHYKKMPNLWKGTRVLAHTDTLQIHLSASPKWAASAAELSCSQTSTKWLLWLCWTKQIMAMWKFQLRTLEELRTYRSFVTWTVQSSMDNTDYMRLWCSGNR